MRGQAYWEGEAENLGCGFEFVSVPILDAEPPLPALPLNLEAL